MDKRVREKIALVFFVLLIIMTAALLFAYFTTGRNWNVAASYVDDQVGEMEDYTVLVYNGTVPVTSEEDATTASNGASWASENANVGASGEDLSDGSQADLSNDEERYAAGPSTTLMDSAESDEILDLGILESEPPERVYVSDIRNAYENKGASVLTLMTNDPDYYEEPTVLYAGERMFGVFSVDYYATEARLKNIAKAFRDEGVETIVCIATSSSMLATPKYADVVIITSDEEGLTTSGRLVEGAFVAESPDTDSVGAVVITSTNISSARVIKAS